MKFSVVSLAKKPLLFRLCDFKPRGTQASEKEERREKKTRRPVKNFEGRFLENTIF